ncbi:MAG: hypothetical protein ACI9XJ_002559 [Marivirga sp.]|jgi:hypothetical protein
MILEDAIVNCWHTINKSVISIFTERNLFIIYMQA